MVLVCGFVAACASPTPSPTTISPSPPSPGPAQPSPSPSSNPPVVLSCFGSPGTSGDSGSRIINCANAEAAALAAATVLGYPVDTITIGYFRFTCGGPFPSGDFACPAMIVPMVPAAYVTFVGTAKVAAMIFGSQFGPPGIIASVISFQVPPPGWSIP